MFLKSVDFLDRLACKDTLNRPVLNLIPMALIEATAKQTSLKGIAGPRIFMHDDAPLNKAGIALRSARFISLTSFQLEELIP